MVNMGRVSDAWLRVTCGVASILYLGGCGAAERVCPEPVVAQSPTVEIERPQPAPVPTVDPFVELRRRHIDMHATNICRVLSDGRMGCWDYPEKGAWVLPGEERFVSVSSHLNRPHGLTADGIVVEWEDMESLFLDQLSLAGISQDQAGGQSSLYLTDRGQLFHTTMVSGLGGRRPGLDGIVFISRGSGSFAAIDKAGDLYAFTVFQGSHLMAGVTVGASRKPVRVPLGGTVTHAELSMAFGCAVVDRQVRCWTEQVVDDIKVPPAVRVGMSDEYGCALSAESQVWCWPFDKKHAWVQDELRKIQLPPDVLDISVARMGRAACAVTRDDTFCWGERFGSKPQRMKRPKTVYALTEPDVAP